MKMFTDCSGECCVCANGIGCLAGHGEDCFYPASKERIIENLRDNKYPTYRQYMKDYLLHRHGVKFIEED